MTLKAFIVQEDNEGSGGVLFAEHAIIARRNGANEYNDGELRGMTVKRAAHLDKYSPGPVPWVEMFDMGWWIECSDCGTRICEDHDEEDEGSENGRRFNIVEHKGHVFCRPACCENWKAEKVEIERIKRYVIARLQERIIRAMPGALILDSDRVEGNHVYVPHGQWPLYPKEASVHFTFPGQRHGTVKFKFNAPGETPRCWVPRGDLNAFLRWGII